MRSNPSPWMVVAAIAHATILKPIQSFLGAVAEAWNCTPARRSGRCLRGQPPPSLFPHEPPIGRFGGVVVASSAAAILVGVVTTSWLLAFAVGGGVLWWLRARR